MSGNELCKKDWLGIYFFSIKYQQFGRNSEVFFYRTKILRRENKGDYV